MKKFMLPIAALIFWTAVAPDVNAQATPSEETLDSFQWLIDDLRPLGNATTFVNAGWEGNETWASVDNRGKEALQITLRTLGPGVVSRITSSHYAITGRMSYSGVSANSYLEMWSYFAPPTSGGPEGAYYSRTLADGGPMAKMEGTDDEQDFILPFDATGAKTKLIRLEFNLHLTGPGNVRLWDVKLVQYPSFGVTAQVPSAATNPSPSSINWKSFGLGAVSLASALVVIGTFSFIFLRVRRRHNERELRRIASIDG